MRSGRDALRLAVQLLRLVDRGRDRVARVVRDLRDPAGEVVADGLVLLRRDRPLGLAAGDVQEDARVVAALPPRRRPRPVDADVAQRGDAVRLGERREQPLATEPFVDADPAVEPLRAVVGEDEDDGVLVRVLEELREQAVDVAVVVEDRGLVRVARLVLAVLGVHVLPEPVVHAVGPHLDHREERPRLRREQVLGEREPPVGHLVHLPEEVLLVVRAEVLRVEEVLADDLGDLVLQRRRVGVLRVERRRQEAPDHDAVQRLRRVAAGHGEDDRRAAGARDESQSRGSLIAVDIAMNPPSYVWSERFRKP